MAAKAAKKKVEKMEMAEPIVEEPIEELIEEPIVEKTKSKKRAIAVISQTLLKPISIRAPNKIKTPKIPKIFLAFQKPSFLVITTESKDTRATTIKYPKCVGKSEVTVHRGIGRLPKEINPSP